MGLAAVDVLVIALANLIVEANHADALDHEGQTIFKLVLTPGNR